MKAKTFFLAALLGTAALHSTAQSVIDSGYCGANAGGGTNLTWTLCSDSTLTIYGSGNMMDFPYTDSPPWYSYRNQIQIVIIGDSVTSISKAAFYNYICLISVNMGNNLTNIGTAVFDHCYSLTAINVGSGNANYTSDDGILYNKNKTHLIRCPGGKSGNYTIPNNVTTIGEWAFYFCKNLNAVTIGNSVKIIEYSAFVGCTGLISVSIGNSIIRIEQRAFGACYNLTSITIHSITPPIWWDPNWNNYALDVFYGVPDTVPVYVPCKSIPAYQNSAGWNYFSNYIGFMDTTFIYGTVCPNTIYNGNGFNIPAISGIYYRTEITPQNCDSVICLTLVTHDLPVPTVLTASICEGETYSDSNFTNLTQAGTYYDTLQNINGCDSIIELNLVVYAPSVPFSYSISICENETYTDSNFTNLTQAGTYYDTLQNINGCDSIIELTLTVNRTYIMQICDTIYIGNSYDFHGKLLTENGVYYDTLQSIHGCDSIVELTLTVTGVGIVEASYELQVTRFMICWGEKPPLIPPKGENIPLLRRG